MFELKGRELLPISFDNIHSLFINASYIVKGSGTTEVHEAEEIAINSKSTTVSFGSTSPIPENSTLIMTMYDCMISDYKVI